MRVQLFSVEQQLSRREVPALATLRVVFIMVAQAEIAEIAEGGVGAISIDVCNLTVFLGCVAMQPEAERTSPSRIGQHLEFGIQCDMGALRHDLVGKYFTAEASVNRRSAAR